MGAKDIAYLFKRHVTANYETSAEVISNRDIKFKSTFWRTLIIFKEIKQKLSTSTHS